MKFLKYFSLIIFLFQFCCSTIQTSYSTLNFNSLLVEFNNSSSGRIFVAAHRAQHTKYPENSLKAIQHAINSKIDIVEIDVRETKDGKLILMHDGSIDRTTHGKGEVEDLTFSQLKKIKLRNTVHDTLSHFIPTLMEALLLAKNKIMVDLDIKGASVKQMVSIVKATGTENQVIFFDSEFPVIDSLMILDPSLILMPRARSKSDVKKIIDLYSPKIIHIDDSFYNAEIVSMIKESGARIWINALGEPDINTLMNKSYDDYNYLVSGGANIIQTDLPITLAHFLKYRDQ